ncbi:response regulator transcription factor [Vagococcus elongatus]|uniref:DNA-binding response regulator n=1 Tax=Vagococcus elongatus TaxID=180344 RepID=A0A430B4L7_9ENTE|nr:response regulator transcription factor [Vagococcus elongatus]RSU15264.1 DNA-binding response regulator [Vagococcus elongatus]
MKILIVEDEQNILDIIVAYLEKQNFEVVTAKDGLEALEQFEQTAPHLLVLDLMLPKLDGISVAKKIRQHSDTPIIMLTAKSSEDDILLGLDLGADDYMTKPFSPKELVARIKTVLKRCYPETNDTLHFPKSGLIIDQQSRKVTLQDIPISLTATEFDLLVTFAAHPTLVFSREQLIDHIFGPDFEGYERAIDSHIKNLRHKLGDKPKSPHFIATVHGVGYRFGESV